jgi:hypothetical protein
MIEATTARGLDWHGIFTGAPSRGVQNRDVLLAAPMDGLTAARGNAMPIEAPRPGSLAVREYFGLGDEPGRGVAGRR